VWPLCSGEEGRCAAPLLQYFLRYLAISNFAARKFELLMSINIENINLE